MATILYAPFTANTLGNNTIIAGNNATPTIQVLGVFAQCSVATNLTIKSGSTALTGDMMFGSGGTFRLDNNGQAPYFECDNGDSFIFNLSGLTGSCAGFVMYYQY